LLSGGYFAILLSQNIALCTARWLCHYRYHHTAGLVIYNRIRRCSRSHPEPWSLPIAKQGWVPIYDYFLNTGLGFESTRRDQAFLHVHPAAVFFCSSFDKFYEFSMQVRVL